MHHMTSQWQATLATADGLSFVGAQNLIMIKLCVVSIHVLYGFHMRIEVGRTRVRTRFSVHMNPVRVKDGRCMICSSFPHVVLFKSRR